MTTPGGWSGGWAGGSAGAGAGGWPGGRPEPRIGDKERDAAVAALGEHFAAGRITQEEFEERSSAAWQARTASALAPLFADLPAPHGVPQGWQQGWPGSGPARGYPFSSGYPVAPPRPRQRSRFPWVALIVALLVLSAVTKLPFLLIGVLVWVAVSCSRWGRSSCQSSGSRRDSRGNWS